MAGRSFLDREQRTVPTSAGSIDFPILYSDTNGFFAFFSTNQDAAERKLAGTGLDTVHLPWPRSKKVLVGVAFFEYVDCTIGPYNEAAIAVPVAPRSRRDRGRAQGSQRFLLSTLLKKPADRSQGMYILELPVSTPIACAGGREVYGYPKFVADIPVEFGTRRFAGEVIDPDTGELIVRLSGQDGRRVGARNVNLNTYSNRDGDLIHTAIELEGKSRMGRGSGYTLEVGPSKHSMAETLRDFGLDGKNPSFVMRSDHYQVVLPEGAVAESDVTRRCRSDEP